MAKLFTEILLAVAAACPEFVDVFHISILIRLVLISQIGLFNASNARFADQIPEDL